MIERFYERSGRTAPASAVRLAGLLLATAAGNRLERAVSSDAPAAAVLGELLAAADERPRGESRLQKRKQRVA